MRTLFFKIFLWFWITMILIIGVFVAFAMMSDTAALHDTRFRGIIENQTTMNGKMAVDAWSRGGRASLHEGLTQGLHSPGMKGFLFDADGNELSGRGEMEGAAVLAQEVRKSGEFQVRTERSGLVAGAPIVKSNGQSFVFILTVSPPWSLGEFWTSPMVTQLLARLCVIVVTVGGVCYALARYLAGPISSLRKATRRLAEGDLSTRVGAQASGRRDEIGDLSRDFNFMAGRIESLVLSQQRLFRDVSHELRSPLARLVVALELAKRRSGPEAATALEQIERDAERLNALIAELLTLVRLDNEVEPYPRTEVDLDALVNEVSLDADFEARTHDRRVRVTFCDPCCICGVPELLRRAIENVVRNGVTHTRAGTEVEVSLETLVERDLRVAMIVVRDHGPGVPDANLTDIFRPFYRLDEARQQQNGNVGLGLAITKRAIRLHDGLVHAMNAVDGGLIVTMRLPVNTAN